MGEMRSAYIGLGGNIGDVVNAMRLALRRLEQTDAISVQKVSSVYRTPPWGKEDQDWFLNACAELETGLDPAVLLEQCLKIEREQKRERRERWGPRTLDIDLLTMSDVELSGETLELPHPRMHQRAFVMQPLADIAPKLLIHGKTVAEHAQALHDPRMEKVSLRSDWYLIGSN